MCVCGCVCQTEILFVMMAEFVGLAFFAVLLTQVPHNLYEKL
eukprot:COSAG05_NODE_3442_length_2060_cov_5.664196_5_plen_42_part_00